MTAATNAVPGGATHKAAGGTDAIVVEGLAKSFGGRKVVDDLSIRVGTGRIFGFLGPNGSGKTTTIRMLCGLLTPDAGKGTCLGLDILTESAAIKRQVGYMTQRFSLYEDLTIRENLDFVARMYQMRERTAAVSAAIERLGLGDRQSQLAGKLSGGWKQRLALAACILHGPKLLLLDEPTAGVDPKARREFWDQIHMLAAEGMTVLVSTHYMDEAERCHEIAYIAYGRLMTQGTVAEVIAQSGLTTWMVSGERMGDLASELRRQAGIDMVAPFGQTLHVSGADPAALERAVAPFRQTQNLRWEPSSPSLEDVFILLMGRARDNFQ
jgi:ABC-2 type transport system ATP-binding protein